MTHTEQGFVYGLAIICVISLLAKYVFGMLFYNSLDDKQKTQAENQQPIEFNTRSMVYAVISYIAHCSFFLNTAILVALYIKERL